MSSKCKFSLLFMTAYAMPYNGVIFPCFLYSYRNIDFLAFDFKMLFYKQLWKHGFLANQSSHIFKI